MILIARNFQRNDTHVILISFREIHSHPHAQFDNVNFFFFEKQIRLISKPEK